MLPPTPTPSGVLEYHAMQKLNFFLTRSLAIGCLACLYGCSAGEPIRSYTVTTNQEPVVPVKTGTVAAHATGADRSRTLGLIIPLEGNYSRFVKFRGTIEQIATYEAGFLALINSITDVGTEAEFPKYALPDGWKENPPRKFVAKSFNVGAAGVPDVTISQPIGGSLLDNVNRWRKENGAPEVTDDELPKVIRELTLGGKKAYFVDARGPADPKGGAMRGPFQGGGK